MAESNFRTFVYTITDAVQLAFAPFISLLSTAISAKDAHHLQPKQTEALAKAKAANQIMPPTKDSKGRTCIYLTDLDDSFISWDVNKTSKWKKLLHKTIYRSEDEGVKYFAGAKDYIKELKENNVKTAIVSNKDHDKLIAQSVHNKWDSLFDKIIGHDRLRAFFTRKASFSAWYNLPALALERLTNTKLHKGMEPVNVIFVGDRPDQDMAAANALDKKIKELNPNSSCTSILLNSRNFTADQVAKLPRSQQPTYVAKDYNDIKCITNVIFDIDKKEKTVAQVVSAEKTTAVPEITQKIDPKSRMEEPLKTMPDGPSIQQSTPGQTTPQQTLPKQALVR